MSPALCALLLSLSATVHSAHADDTPAKVVFDVRDYGAAGDGKSLDTEAINAAIDAASAAGGGTVYFRAGTYISYSIHLKSNITLFLDQGCILKAAGTPQTGRGGRGVRGGGEPAPTTAASTQQVAAITGGNKATGIAHIDANGIITAVNTTTWDRAEPNQWDMYQDYGHSHFHNSFIWGENLHDIAIIGPGLIDGSSLPTNSNANSATANKTLALKQCRNVTLRDFSVLRGGWFCLLANGVDNFTLDNLKFDTNRDSADIISCKNVHMSNCYVNSPSDDGICLKSDYALGMPRACENITITNCQVSGYVVGSLLNGTFDRSNTRAADGDGPTGRIKFGTESNGGFKNITISNCVFDHCRGLAMEAVDGAVIEDITVSNITMRDIFNSPIYIRLGERQRGPQGIPIAQVRRINISNVSAICNNPNLPVLISGMPDHSIEDVTLSNIRLVYPGGGTAQQAAVVPPERERQDYPEPSRLGPLPSSAFFIRHVKNLQMHHVDVTFAAADARPLFNLTDVQGADFQHMKIQRFDGIPYFALNNVTDFSTQYVRGIADLTRAKIDKEMIDK